MKTIICNLLVFISLWGLVKARHLHGKSKEGSARDEDKRPDDETQPQNNRVDVSQNIATANDFTIQFEANPVQVFAIHTSSSAKSKAQHDFVKYRRENTKTRPGNGSNRQRRQQHGNGYHARHVCKTKSEFGVLREARDVNGDIVKVAPLFEIDGVRIEQTFFESYCDVEKCKCRGIINTDMYETACETNHMYTYARVMKDRAIGWTHIKIRSGCSCKIREKWQPPERNIIDLI